MAQVGPRRFNEQGHHNPNPSGLWLGALKEVAMKPVALTLGTGLLMGLFVVAFGHGAQAASVTAPGSASDETAASPQIQAHVERLNRAFSGFSFTTYSNL